MTTQYELDNIDKRYDLDIFGIYTAELALCDILHKRKRRGLKKQQQDAFRRAMRHVKPHETIMMRLFINRLPDGRPDVEDLGLQFSAEIVDKEYMMELDDDYDPDNDDF